MTQALLPVGCRCHIHRRNAEGRCLTLLENGTLCQELQTLEHTFKSCEMVTEVYEAIVQILNRFLSCTVTFDS